uniref:Ig-like domain-containing protein n=1 Tax=Echeneis naucrates TaxID=173247 RepID=A0A665UHL6_ECHNA
MLVFCFFKGKQVLKLNCFGFKVSAAAQIEIFANPNCTTELSPPHIVVPYGGSFSVNCSTSPTLTEGMGWEASQDGIPLKDGVSFLSLTVSNVTDWKISAQCFSNLKDGEQCVKKLPIAVYKMPDHVSMSLPSLMGPMVEDEEYRLKCGIVNVAPARNVYVRWYKGSQLIQETSNDTSLLPVNMSFDFDLRAQSGDDGTQIWCEASLQFFAPGPKFPPMRSESHELIVFFCLSLLPIIQDKVENQKESEVVLARHLQFPGTYACTVSNERGTRTKYFTVNPAPSKIVIRSLYLSYSGAHYDLAQKKSFSNFLMLLFSVR